VTVAETAAGGNVTIEGEAETAGRTAHINGSDSVSVEEQPEVRITNATREVEKTKLEPNVSTSVTVQVETNATSMPAVYESFGSGFSNVTVVGSEPETAAVGVGEANKHLFAVWNGTDNATLEYEVTPSEKAAGGNVSIEGEAETSDGTVTVDRTNITVQANDATDPNASRDGETEDETEEHLPVFVALTAFVVVALGMGASVWSRRRSSETG